VDCSTEKIALVLEGGGFRGMYTSGVLDALLKYNIDFPYVIGVSAGAAYGISYVSKQFERNKIVNLKYTADPRYMSWGNLWRKGNLFDWDFVYGKIPNRLVPFDYETLFSSPTKFMVGVTQVSSGEARYLSSKEMNNEQLLAAITASSSLPFVSKMACMNSDLFMDGGLADSIPVEKAMVDGNTRAVVILTRNAGYRKKPAKFTWLIKTVYKKYPKLVETILSRADRYNTTLDLLEELEKKGKVFIIRPKGQMEVSRIENNPVKLDRLYQMGFDEMEDSISEMKVWMIQK